PERGRYRRVSARRHAGNWRGVRRWDELVPKPRRARFFLRADPAPCAGGGSARPRALGRKRFGRAATKLPRAIWRRIDRIRRRRWVQVMSRPLSQGRGREMAIDKSAAARLSMPLPESAARPAEEPDLRWDWLLVCVAGYLLTAVGRVHQLFPVLETLRPAMLTGFLAIVMYLLDRREERRSAPLFVPATNYLIAFFIWMVLSVPG